MPNQSEASIVIEVKPPKHIQKILADGVHMIDGFTMQYLVVFQPLKAAFPDAMQLTDGFSFNEVLVLLAEQEGLLDSIFLGDTLAIGLVPASGFGGGGYGVIIYDGSGNFGLQAVDDDNTWDDSGIYPSENYHIAVGETMTPTAGIAIQ